MRGGPQPASRAQSPALPAPLRAIDAIEAAAGPFEEGLAIERQAFLELMQSPESKALRHAFFAERAAGKVSGMSGTPPPSGPLEQAAVIGAGTMGAGIAVCFLDAGIPVWLLEADQAALDRGVARIAGIYDGQVRRGKLAESERDRRLALLTADPVLRRHRARPTSRSRRCSNPWRSSARSSRRSTGS